MLKQVWEKAANLPVIRTLTNRDVRYITLYGNPVHQSPLRTFWRSTSFKVAAALSVPVILSAANAGEVEKTLFLVSDNFFSYIKGITPPMAAQWIMLNFSNPLAPGTCIDKNGKAARVLAHDLASDFLAANYLIASVPMLSVMSFNFYANREHFMHYIGNIMTGQFEHDPSVIILGVCLAETLSMLNRSSKIIRNEWVLVNMPDPHEEKGKDKNEIPGAAREPT